jgi:cAMP-dependent protein kinase regulator
MRNLRKKADYIREKLNHDDAASDEEDGDDSPQSEEEQDSVKPESKLKTRHAMQRAGVSAEVYGAWNQKGEFVPKVVPKSEEVKAKLKKRLLEAFMFNALEDNELDIVVDSIEEL